MRLFVAFVFSLAGLLLAGCEQLGIETPAQQMVRAEADGKAIGSSCRHSGRALEDCYQLNPKASKSAIFTGWRDMDTYMRENKLEAVPPQFPMTPPPPKKKAGAATAGKEEPVHEAKTTEPPAPSETKPADSKSM
jgi:hypothetical protein